MFSNFSTSAKTEQVCSLSAPFQHCFNIYIDIAMSVGKYLEVCWVFRLHSHKNRGTHFLQIFLVQTTTQPTITPSLPLQVTCFEIEHHAPSSGFLRQDQIIVFHFQVETENKKMHGNKQYVSLYFHFLWFCHLGTIERRKWRTPYWENSARYRCFWSRLQKGLHICPEIYNSRALSQSVYNMNL